MGITRGRLAGLGRWRCYRGVIVEWVVFSSSSTMERGNRERQQREEIISRAPLHNPSHTLHDPSFLSPPQSFAWVHTAEAGDMVCTVGCTVVCTCGVVVLWCAVVHVILLTVYYSVYYILYTVFVLCTVVCTCESVCLSVSPFPFFLPNSQFTASSFSPFSFPLPLISTSSFSSFSSFSPQLHLHITSPLLPPLQPSNQTPCINASIRRHPYPHPYPYPYPYATCPRIQHNLHKLLLLLRANPAR